MIATKANIKDFMTDKVIFAHSKMSFTQTCRLLFELNIHHLPILDEDKQLIGMISSNDLLKVFSYQLPLLPKADEKTLNDRFSILEIMTPKPVTIQANCSIEEAAQVFNKEKIQSLPVIENGQMIGIFTGHDLINVMAFKANAL